MGPREPLVLRSQSTLSNDESPTTEDDNTITILGFGSLLSEGSSRMTFPNLKNFRMARVPGYRRVFDHPASIFFQRNIVRRETLEMSSLSVEYVDESFPGFLCSAFEVGAQGMMENGAPSRAFLEREEEYNIMKLRYLDLSTDLMREGICCLRSSDEEYRARWGDKRFNDNFTRHGIDTLWNWSPDSGLRPCAVYLRHCYLAAKNMGGECLDSFLDDTFLIDRKTSIREYLCQYPTVLDAEPPPELRTRYCG